jgi:2,3-bisphosphoglycerate-dependent phosphoglycerate mutase
VTIHLVRHAETVFNATRVVQPADTPLSERGRAQAERLAARLAHAGIRTIRTSDLPRALATAEAIARRTGAALEIDPDLAERNYGAIRGTPYAELREDIFGPDYVPPGGECWQTFHARVDRAWARIVAAAAATDALAVVTHGLVCWSIVSRHVTGGSEACESMRFANTSLTLLEGPPWRAGLVDCTAHLDAATRGDGMQA